MLSRLARRNSATNRELDVSLSHHVACLLRDLDRSGDTVHEATFPDALAVAARVVRFGVEESLRVAFFILLERILDEALMGAGLTTAASR